MRRTVVSPANCSSDHGPGHDGLRGDHEVTDEAFASRLRNLRRASLYVGNNAVYLIAISTSDVILIVISISTSPTTLS